MGAVRTYELQIRGTATWRPDRIAFRRPRIAVQYRCRRGSEQMGRLVELSCDNGEVFTAGELLFKVHNAVVEDLRDGGHHFFEGLEFSGLRESDWVAEYVLVQGS